ncbi:MAG: tetratricopeptide repeat protein [Calditrichaeota bacterium]|nr:MAG: tetratricopeptide repeat protein [Calditrichota bacterium]
MRQTVATFLFILCFLGVRQSRAGETTLADSIQFLIQQAQFSEATRLAEQALKEHPEEARLFYLAGTAWQGLFNPLKALTYFQGAERLAPYNPTYLFALARIYYQLSRYQDAERLFKRILANQPDHQAARLWLADCQFSQQQYGAALQIYRAIVQRDSLNLFVLQRTATCLQRLGNASEALAFWQKLIELDPGNIPSAQALAKFYLSKNQLDSARAILTTALSYNPHSSSLLKLRARVAYRAGNYRQAASVYRQLLAQGDSSSFVLRRLGSCLLYVDSLQAAETFLMKATARDSTDALSWFYLGLLYNEQESYAKSARALERAIQLSRPDFLADAFAQLATAYQALGKHSQAIQAFKQALKLDSTQTALWFYLASTYDAYYADRRVPLFYYRKFLEVAGNSADPALNEYARFRIEKLVEEIHFHQHGQTSTVNRQNQIDQGG